MAQVPVDQRVELTLDSSKVLAELDKIKAAVAGMLDLQELADLVAPLVLANLRSQARSTSSQKTTPGSPTQQQQKNSVPSRDLQKHGLTVIHGGDSTLST